MIQTEDVTIELRLVNKTDSKIKAFVDVMLNLGDGSSISISGFSVVGNPPRVVPPARKGEQRYFDIVLLTGKVKTIVYTLIGTEYKNALEKAAKETS